MILLKDDSCISRGNLGLSWTKDAIAPQLKIQGTGKGKALEFFCNKGVTAVAVFSLSYLDFTLGTHKMIVDYSAINVHELKI